MTLDPGDETHLNGDYIKVDSIDNSVEPGMPVADDGSGNIVPLSEGTQYLGVFQLHGRPDSGIATVKVQGTVMAFVDSGVTAYTHLGSPATSASPAEDADAFGTNDDQDVIALEDSYDEDGDGDYVAEVLLR